MPQIISLGEALIDFVSLQTGVEVKDAPGFLRAAGGAPANLAAALGKLGVDVGFIGKVGDDPFGHFLQETLVSNGVDISQLLFEKSARTALAFVSLRSDGERSFSFYRHPSADMLLNPKEIDENYLGSARIF
ncbi:MAG: fructokinase, partial [Candidatus Latescibacteria bacterium]|nr:fructokinase [Candidatus Latescibacterota bacterium]